MERKCINGNILKIIAVISMTIDHMGLMLFNDNLVMRCIGRLAFPIFGFMIAEGCFYTKNKLRYFLRVFILGMLCQVAYYIADSSLYLGILITFSLSIATIFAYKSAFEKEHIEVKYVLLFLLALCVDVALCVVFPIMFKNSGFCVDYGIFGVLFPVLAYIGRGKKHGIILMAAGLAMISLTHLWYQWFSLAALILIAFYSGERGRKGGKYFFYIYYPAHLAAIWLISYLMVNYSR